MMIEKLFMSASSLKNLFKKIVESEKTTAWFLAFFIFFIPALAVLPNHAEASTSGGTRLEIDFLWATEEWLGNSEHLIKWKSENISAVDIALYKNGKTDSHFDRMIATGYPSVDSTFDAVTNITKKIKDSLKNSTIPGDNNYTFTVPCDLETGQEYYIQVRNPDYPLMVVTTLSYFSFTPGSACLPPPPTPKTITATFLQEPETWSRGAEKTLSWSYTGDIGAVEISLYKNGIFDSLVATSSASAGTFLFTVPTELEEGTEYSFRISELADPAVFGHTTSYFTLPSLPPPPLASSTITATFLNSPEIWENGQGKTLSWNSEGDISSVHIDLFKDGAFETRVATGTTNTGSFVFTVPNDLEEEKQYSFRICDNADETIYDDTNSYFTLVVAPPPPPPPTATSTITVTNPAGGEQWYIGDSYNITWTSTGSTTDVVLYLCEAVATSTCNILKGMTASGTPNTGSYSWTIDSLQAGLVPGHSYVIRAEDANFGDIFDLSEAFTISEKSLPPVNPPPVNPPGGGGGGGNGPIQPIFGFRVFNERVIEIGYGEALITWNTDRNASEQVFYGETSELLSGVDNFSAKYSASSTKTFSSSTIHAVVISGLKENTRYYFRPYSDTATEKAGGVELSLMTSGAEDNGTCEYIIDPLRLNRPENRLDDTLKLQTYLKKWGYDVDITGTFDIKTDVAVRQYQEKHREEILSPWGISEPTGYVYLTTRKHINETECKRPYPLTAEQQAEIDMFKNYIQTSPIVPEIGLEVGLGETDAETAGTENSFLIRNESAVGLNTDNTDNDADNGDLKANSVGLIKPPVIKDTEQLASAGIATGMKRATSTDNIKKASAFGTITAPIVAAPKFIKLGVERLLDLAGL